PHPHRHPPRALQGARRRRPGAHARGASPVPRGLRDLARGLREAAAIAVSCRALIGVVAVFLSSARIAAPISVTDDLGRKVQLNAPAKRIVTLAPFLTELTFSAGAGERLVGVSAYSDYPEAAKKLPQVATAISLSLEPLLALQPDLVLAWRDTIRSED